MFGTSAANYDELLERYGLTAQRIIDCIKSLLR
jgi:transketolase C-terminal domain/subunit